MYLADRTTTNAKIKLKLLEFCEDDVSWTMGVFCGTKVQYNGLTAQFTYSLP